MITKKILCTIVLFLTASLILLPANASLVLNLPTDPVTVSATPSANPPGVWPATVALSGISGGPYDVTNGDYMGWCADFYELIDPDTPYSATLISSLTEPTPWDKINYLLNYVTNFDMDVQVAIWLLLEVGTSGTLAEVSADIGSRYSGQPTTEALALYNYADSNGGGFDPTCGDWIAVLCVTEPGVQDLFVQIRITCQGPGLTPGFWKHNVGVYLGLKNGAYSDPVNSPVVTKDTMGDWLAGLDSNNGGPLDLLSLFNAMSTKGGGAAGAATRNNAANVFNALAGLAPL